MKIVFLGSVKQEDQMKKIAKEFQDHYSAVYGECVDITIPSKDVGKDRFELAIKWYNLMDEANLIIVIPKPDLSVGEAVSYELAYAKKNFPGKILIYHD